MIEEVECCLNTCKERCVAALYRNCRLKGRQLRVRDRCSHGDTLRPELRQCLEHRIVGQHTRFQSRGVDLVKRDIGKQCERLCKLPLKLFGCMLLHLVGLALVDLYAPIGGVLVAPFAAHSHHSGCRISTARQPRGHKLFGQAVRTRAVNVPQAERESLVKHSERMLSHLLHSPLLGQVFVVAEVDVARTAERSHAKTEARRARKRRLEVGARRAGHRWKQRSHENLNLQHAPLCSCEHVFVGWSQHLIKTLYLDRPVEAGCRGEPAVNG